jgi:cytochrome c556
MPLKQVGTIKKNAEAAVTLKPQKLADIPEPQRAKFLADYQEQMKHFLADVNALEAALKAGNNAEAGALVKKLKADMDEGHKEFRKEKKRPGGPGAPPPKPASA